MGDLLEKHFSMANLRLKVLGHEADFNDHGFRVLPKRENGRLVYRQRPFRIEIKARGKKTETFLISHNNDAEIRVLDADAELRNLVLFAKFEEPPASAGQSKPQFIKNRFLVGHDERENFIAELPSGSNATTVIAARDQLKPREVLAAEIRGARVLRQGEWFFIPTSKFSQSVSVIYKNEPLILATGSRLFIQGKPHFVDELVRTARRPIEVDTGRRDATGRPITRSMTEVAEVFARGKIRHPDHKTLKLLIWHRVVPNTQTFGGAATTFVD